MLSRDGQHDESQLKRSLRPTSSQFRTHYRGFVGGAYVRLYSESRKEIDNKDHVLLFKLEQIYFNSRRLLLDRVSTGSGSDLVGDWHQYARRILESDRWTRSLPLPILTPPSISIESLNLMRTTTRVHCCNSGGSREAEVAPFSRHIFINASGADHIEEKSF